MESGWILMEEVKSNGISMTEMQATKITRTTMGRTYK